MTQSVFLPLIKRLDIDDYLMYPGDAFAPGLHHEFLTGVNVIVGVNGLGKTTLLRTILRILTGPRDLRAGEELGGVQRELSRSVDFAEFARRVPDQAATAIATLKFEMNGRTVEVRRSLKDLKLLSFSVDPDLGSLPESLDLEEQYEWAIVQLSGLVAFYDFVFFLRHVIFFLEDRRGLVWDRWAQTEILQMLFLSSTFQLQYRDALREALSADSAARNTQAVLTRERKRLNGLVSAAATSPVVELGLLRTAVEALGSQIADLENEVDELDKQRREQRRIAESRAHDATILAQREREVREALLAQIFPSLSDYGAMTLSYMERGLGCIVCGTKDSDYLKEASKRWLERQHCPVCDAPPDLQEPRPLAQTNRPDLSSDLSELETQRQSMRVAATNAEQSARELNDQYAQSLARRDRLVVDHHEKADQLRVREAAAREGSSDQVTAQDDRVRVLEETVADYRATKNTALGRINALMQSLRENVEGFQVSMCEAFNTTIKQFLAEECTLSYRVSPRKIGQFGDNLNVAFPEFVVRMTSGVFRVDSEIRESSESVSESQREFIELSFRMSFLSIALARSPTTLVFDTPEASLDAVFIPRAGRAFSSYASSGECERIVIAASNLNGTEMIRSMLEVPEDSAEPVTQQNRIINLLKIAARGRALEVYADQYSKALDASLAPRVIG